jgi:hypothetical protein
MDLSKIAYVAPILQPYTIDPVKFWSWWDEVTVPIVRLQRDSRGNGGGFDGEFWDGVTIWQSSDYQKHIVWKVNYVPNEELFGDLTKRILEELSWFDIKGITLWSNKQRIGAHHDGLPRDIFPSAPRISLIDECENRTFYLTNKKNFKKFIPDLTTGPNLFLFNNENYVHGAVEPIGGRKVLVRIDGPLVDPEGLQKFLLEQIANGAKYEGIK